MVTINLPEPGPEDVWGAELNAAINALAAAINAGSGGTNSNVVVLARNSNGTWPAIPSPAPEHIQWWDLTGLAPSDPPNYRPTKDIIYDPGTV